MDTLARTARLVMLDTRGLVLLNWLELVKHPGSKVRHVLTDKHTSSAEPWGRVLTLPDHLQVKLDGGVLLRQLVHAEAQLCQHLSNHSTARQPQANQGAGGGAKAHQSHLKTAGQRRRGLTSQVSTDLGPALHGVAQVTHHHLGLVLLLVGAGEPAESLTHSRSSEGGASFNLPRHAQSCPPGCAPRR